MKIVPITEAKDIYLLEDLYREYCQKVWEMPMNIVQLGWTTEGRSYMTEAQIAILDDMQNGCRFHVALSESSEPLGFIVFRKARFSVIMEGVHVKEGYAEAVVPQLIRSTAFNQLFFKYEGLRNYLQFLDNVKELHSNDRFRLMTARGVKS